MPRPPTPDRPAAVAGCAPDPPAPSDFPPLDCTQARDGAALAWAFAEALRETGALSLLSTHAPMLRLLPARWGWVGTAALWTPRQAGSTAERRRRHLPRAPPSTRTPSRPLPSRSGFIPVFEPSCCRPCGLGAFLARHPHPPRDRLPPGSLVPPNPPTPNSTPVSSPPPGGLRFTHVVSDAAAGDGEDDDDGAAPGLPPHYGLAAAAAAGVPPDVVAEARTLAARLEAEGSVGRAQLAPEPDVATLAEAAEVTCRATSLADRLLRGELDEVGFRQSLAVLRETAERLVVGVEGGLT